MMTQISRRGFTLAGLSALALAGCSNGIGMNGAQDVNARVDAALNYLFNSYPGTRNLASQAAGMLVMPLITEAGLGLGGAYGRGALRVNGQTVDFYSAASASAGVQVGVHQYSHVLFFMTQDALQEFRTSYGWVAGAGIDYAMINAGEMLVADTTTSLSPVIAVVFGQSGLRLGASVEGTKYTRIIP